MVKLQLIQRYPALIQSSSGPVTLRRYDLVINDVVVASLQEQTFMNYLLPEHFDNQVATLVALYEKALGVSAEIVVHPEEN